MGRVRRVSVSRRTLIAGSVAGAAAIGAGAIAWPGHDTAMPGTLSGADLVRGHRLRDGAAFPAPTSETSTGIAILGGGVAGLSAAWTLAEAGVTNFRLYELEDHTGGNARGGKNAVSAYPLGAHYLPIPNEETKGVVRLLERLGVVTGWQGGKPLYDPYQLVSDPDERLLHLGKWQEGLVPTIGLTPADRHDLDGFFTAMAAFRDRRDAMGRPAFAIPMEYSSRDPDLLALDQLSFTAWLDAQGWRSPVLRGHVRYACRDDYGTEPDQTSAWAGIHYFAGRREHSANAGADTVLTWPEGNAHLAGRMAAHLKDHLACGQIIHRVRTGKTGVEIDSFDVATGTGRRIKAQAAILAMPHFITARVLPTGTADAAGFGYAPWIVANVTVDRAPAGAGFNLAWDNVSWTSKSLGYVVATHQSLASTPGPTVLTWYMAMSDTTPAAARRELLDRPLEHWQDTVRADLIETNPDLKGAIRRIDVWRWGHAMIRPTPGFFWSGAREKAATPQPPLFFAHSDLSGLSLFEEAHYRGTLAAQNAMTHLGIPHSDLLI
ncbi:hypothetical protein ACVWZA_001437 [Sphingomonas sp. UYAg733]